MDAQDIAVLFFLLGACTTVVLRRVFYRLMGICPRCVPWLFFEGESWTGAHGWCPACGFTTGRAKK